MHTVCLVASSAYFNTRFQLNIAFPKQVSILNSKRKKKDNPPRQQTDNTYAEPGFKNCFVLKVSRI